MPFLNFIFFDYLPKLQSEKNPIVAFFVGLFFGFVGCAFYFGTFADFLIPLILSILLILPGISIFAIPLVTGLYGYFRAVNANRRLGK
ncbi:hypothetical protein [Nostoc sp. FACHB-190]|uniref:hypothetical protein n=1 Tax=Nostoc sp. FACHB-190 TaxID=2692838 RepID=UPI00168675F9|nr:hypothetical protein [Nostoc sp. FACHB-190]MBD2303174.1 hypothetical protein [Nostoc sp. FACHB-190]